MTPPRRTAGTTGGIAGTSSGESGGLRAATGEAALAARLPDVETQLLRRWPESRVDPTLEREARLVRLLGDPQHAVPALHITGTNGKTSTARMIETLLRAFGLRTGRYTSPHLMTMRERIAVDGDPLPPQRFVEVYDDVAPYVALVDAEGPTALSFFEVLTAMAFAAFADTPVDASVLEVGMGGRWDATNVVDATVAVVTEVALDHREYLGDTLAEIAGEKAGILKQAATAVLAEQDPEAEAVLLDRAAAVGARLLREGEDFGVVARDVAVGGQLVTLQGAGGQYPDLFLPLHGPHQVRNAACALAAVEAFLAGPDSRLELDTVREGFAHVTSPGRLEVVRRSPTVLVDGAHNPAGAQALAVAIGEAFSFTRLVGLLAVVTGKDAEGILAALEPVLDEVVITRSSSHRAMDVDELAALAVDVFGEQRVEVVPRLPDALDTAITLAEAEGPVGAGVLATGSIITAGEVRRLLGKE